MLEFKLSGVMLKSPIRQPSKQLLVANGADVNAPPAKFAGGTTLQLAAIKDHVGFVK